MPALGGRCQAVCALADSNEGSVDLAWALIGSKSPFGFQLTDNSTGLAGDQREREREILYNTQTSTCAHPQNGDSVTCAHMVP